MRPSTQRANRASPSRTAECGLNALSCSLRVGGGGGGCFRDRPRLPGEREGLRWRTDVGEEVDGTCREFEEDGVVRFMRRVVAKGKRRPSPARPRDDVEFRRSQELPHVLYSSPPWLLVLPAAYAAAARTRLSAVVRPLSPAFKISAVSARAEMRVLGSVRVQQATRTTTSDMSRPAVTAYGRTRRGRLQAQPQPQPSLEARLPLALLPCTPP